MTKEKNLTGYPSINKPWMKYYSKDVEQNEFTYETSFGYIYERNKNALKDKAMIYFGKSISYEELFSMTAKAYCWFEKQGIKNGDRVAFIGITSPEFVSCVYAVNHIGAVSLMIDPRTVAEEIKDRLESVKCLVIMDVCLSYISSINLPDELKNIVVLSIVDSMSWLTKSIYKLTNQKQRLNVDNLVEYKTSIALENDDGKKVFENKIIEQDQSFIFYTGGSTGKPKGVILNNYQFNSVVTQYYSVCKGFERGQSWLSLSAPFAAYSWMTSIHMPLAYGMVLYVEMYEPEKVAKKILKKKINHVAANPAIWDALVHTDAIHKTDLSFLVAPTSGGETLNMKLEKEINDIFAKQGASWKICQGYGMTETASGISINFSNEINKPGSVGIPFPQTVIATFNVESGKEEKIGVIGEICISGPSLMTGYEGDLETTNATIKVHEDGKRWIHTGDLGYVDEDGFVYISGRIKRMITHVTGAKIYPQIVEDAIRQLEDIQDCAVVGVTDPNNSTGKCAAAFVILKDENKDQDEVRKKLMLHCEAKLEDYMRPIAYYFVDEFPRTAVGKVDYKKLENLILNLI